MYKFEIKLKQHTPIIHFQHDQEGATLRASEVKPKLDRFIITKLGEGDYEKGKKSLKSNPEYADWLIANGEFGALNYKLKVFSKEEDKKDITIVPQQKRDKYIADYPFLLANMGGKSSAEELMNFSFYKEITLSFFVLNTTLQEYIKECLPSFFFEHNFGQRSGKGFGCFSMIGQNYIPPKTRFFKFKCSDNQEGEKLLFEVLDYYYKRLKSGINYTGRKIDEENNITYKKDPQGILYRKSFLSSYIISLGYKWDKPKIKCDLFLISKGGKINESYKKEDKTIYARALLGIPDKYEYSVKRAEHFINYNNKISERETKFQVDIESTLERIPSPILLKPYFTNTGEVIVYVLIDNTKAEAMESIHGESVKFTKKRKTNGILENSNPPVETKINIISKFPDKLFDYNNLIEKYHNELSQDFLPVNFRGPLLDITNKPIFGQTAK